LPAGASAFTVYARALMLLLVAGIAGSSGCALDRSGLNLNAILNDGGADAGPGDGAADLVADRPADVVAVIDAPVDRACDSSFHRCGETCVSNSSVSSCGATSCVACSPPPANATATCDGVTCGFSCDTNYVQQGSACVPGCNPLCAAGAIPVAAPGGRFMGTTSGASANAGSCGGGSAPEVVYQLVLTVPSDVFVTTHGSKLDTVIYMRRGCCGAEIACNDNIDGRNTSALTATGLPAGTYQIFVDGAGDGAGAYTVDIYASPSSTQPGDSCGRPTHISTTAITGDTCGYRDDYDPNSVSCLNDTGSGLDAVFYFVLDTTSVVTFDTCADTVFDSVLYVRDVCTSAPSERGCVDDPTVSDCASSSTRSKISLTLDPGAHYLVLDTFPGAPCGLFTVTPAGVGP
jgi:hypothetical protein